MSAILRCGTRLHVWSWSRELRNISIAANGWHALQKCRMWFPFREQLMVARFHGLDVIVPFGRDIVLGRDCRGANMQRQSSSGMLASQLKLLQFQLWRVNDSCLYRISNHSFNAVGYISALFYIACWFSFTDNLQATRWRRYLPRNSRSWQQHRFWRHCMWKDL